MGIMRAINLVAAAAGLFLAGCSGGTDLPNTQAAQFGTYVDVLRTRPEATPAVPALTPAVIDGLTVSTLEVQLERTGQTAFLVPYSDRSGGLRTWRTADDVQLTMRSGVLVTTRGLGNDLGSTDAGSAVQSVRTRNAVSGPHTLYVKNGDNGITQIPLSCDMRNLGVEAIEIVQRTTKTVHLQENCSGASAPVTYDYWVDTRDGTVLKSRQWAGPGVGYVQTRLLKK